MSRGQVGAQGPANNPTLIYGRAVGYRSGGTPSGATGNVPGSVPFPGSTGNLNGGLDNNGSGVNMTRLYAFDAYVGGDNVVFGRNWAQYLVDNGLVESGDFVWMPVEVPGATYGVQEEEGIRSVFEPLGITWEVTDATLDQAEIITRMSDYLTANRERIDAIIGLGDLVTGSIKRVFDQVGVKPGEIPVVGWGNSLDTTQEVLTGYVNAAQWQDPQATSYVGLSLAAMAASGIPPGFDVITGALGKHITTHFLEAKRQEWRDYITQVSAWELENYLAKY